MIFFIYSYKESLPVNDANKVVNALEALILQIVNSNDPKYTYQLKLCLRCAVDLCKAHKDHCAVFVELLEFQIVSSDGLFNNIICESLEAIGSIEPQSLIAFFPDFLAKLEELNELPNPSVTQTQTKVMMCTIIFQTLSIYDWRPELRHTINKVIARNNLWANYRIARSAARYGHHQVSYNIFNSLTEHVSSEHLHFWLVSLKEMSEAEAQLLNIDDSMKNSLVDHLNEAISHYNKAIAALKVLRYLFRFSFNVANDVFGYFRQQAHQITIYNFKRNTQNYGRNSCSVLCKLFTQRTVYVRSHRRRLPPQLCNKHATNYKDTDTSQINCENV